MFLAGADGKTPELRPPSIKAAMRFWWRAMNKHDSLNKHDLLAELKKEEAKIFGGSGENEGRSKFNIRVKNIKGNAISSKFPSQMVSATSKGKTFSINILEYLAYGTQEYQKGIGQVFIREYYPVGTTFEIEICYENSLNTFKFDEIFSLISQVGGLGSKGRNGFGRFKITNEENDIRKLIGRLNSGTLKDYLTFNNKLKLFALESSQISWDKCLAEMGKIYKSSREQLEPRHVFNKRQYIASPILDNKRQVTMLDRHSKPYFFIITKNSNNNYDGMILFLPYNYLAGFDNPQKKPTDLMSEFTTATLNFNKILSTKMGVEL
jgi:CRISPR-associated protein Cmr1